MGAIKIDLADLIKETIEDIALARAITAGLMTEVITPMAEFNTNLVQKRRLEFLQSFLDDFSRVKDHKTQADILKVVSNISSGVKIADYKAITTKDILLDFARIKVDNLFICISLEKKKTVLVRVISRKDITRYFLKAN